MTHSEPPSTGTHAAPAPIPAPAADPGGPRRWQSQQLLQGAREVQIEHQGQVYRLQLTALGKLILTK